VVGQMDNRYWPRIIPYMRVVIQYLHMLINTVTVMNHIIDSFIFCFVFSSGYGTAKLECFAIIILTYCINGEE
jgi:hypothetical protein